MLDAEDVERRIADFKAHLPASTVTEVVQRFVLTGPTAFLSDHTYFDLRRDVAQQFNIRPNDVLIVGSAKLGFSIAPEKRYRHFGETSDIDVVLVSDTLFMDLWRRVHDFSSTGGYWPRSNDFKRYLFHGWIRPDMLPNEPTFAEAQEWWEFFNELTASGRFGPVKIRGAIYKDLYFLQSYQELAVRSCRQELESPQ